MFYFIQVNIYAGLMYGIYLCLLRDRTRHAYSRIYLLLCAVLPLILPLIKIPSFAGTLQANHAVSGIILPVVDITGLTNASMHASLSTQRILLIVYCLSVLLLLIRFIIQLIKLRLFIKQYPVEHWENTQLIRNTGKAPGSWRNYIFLPGNQADAAILAHEQAHARLGHSYDLLLLHVLQCFFWPDLVLSFIIKEIKVVHEFQADNDNDANSDEYIAAMLNDTFGTNTFSLAHTFFHHPLKRRIAMLQNKNKNRAPYLLATIVGMAVFSTAVIAQSVKQGTTQNAQANKKSEVLSAGVYKPSEVDSVAQPGGFDISQFMQANLTYPDSARIKKIEGKVITKFVINEQGGIQDVTVLRSPDPILSAAALDVIKKMPHWTPAEKNGYKVKMEFILPVQFKLQ
jgi:TonB family protein